MDRNVEPSVSEEAEASPSRPARRAHAGAGNLRLTERLTAQWRLKLVATPVLVTAFFVAYFFVLKAPIFPVTVMPLTVLDDYVQLSASALPLYLSLWVYVFIALALLCDRRELLAYGRAVIGIATVGLGIFLVFPTAVPVRVVDWATHPAFHFLKTVDAAGNACPSLHVAFALFSAIWLHRLLRAMGDRGLARLLSWVWCAGIIYSTLATQQHVALDVLGGGVLGVAGAVIGLRSARAKRTPVPAERQRRGFARVSD